MNKKLNKAQSELSSPFLNDIKYNEEFPVIGQKP